MRAGAKSQPPLADAQLREVYRCQMNLKGPKNAWNTHTEDFTPKHTKYTPQWGRVMLYAYLGAGQVDFDDVVVKQIVPAATGQDGEGTQALLGHESHAQGDGRERAPQQGGERGGEIG